MQRELGQIIRESRNKKGYTIVELADKLGISTGLLSNIETGKTDSFQLALLNSIVRELSIPLSELKLFPEPYPIEELDIDFSMDLKKIHPSLEALINAFISTASELSFNEATLSLITDILINELQSITKIIEISRSK